MSFTKVTSAGIGSTELVTLDSLEVINNASIGGVLTYEDVTNVDSVGIITARAGVLVGSGITLSKDGDVFFTGIATGNGSGLTALNASNLASGTVPTARLGSGTASSSTFLRGDSTFQTVNTDLVSDTSPQLGGTLDVNGQYISFPDSDGTTNQARFGTGDDLKIYHQSNSSYILNTTGNLNIGSNNEVRIKGGNDAGENCAIFKDNGAVELYYDNSKIFETGSDQATITGKLTINRSSNDEKLILSGSASPYIRFQESTTNKAYMQWSSNGYIEIYNSETSKGMRIGGSGVEVLDDVKFVAGDSQDLQIYHAAGGASHINNTGLIVVDGTTGVRLEYNNATKFETESNGASVTGRLRVQNSGNASLNIRDTSTNAVSAYVEAKTAGTMSYNCYKEGVGTKYPHVFIGYTEEYARIDTHGIKFNGDTASANALDDYEVGTWTPDLRFGGGSSGMTYDSNSRHGEYTRVGNLVTFTFRFTLTNKGSSTGSSLVYGLPFNCADGNGNYSGASFGYLNGLTNSSRWSAYQTPTIDTNTNYIFLRYVITGTDYSLNHNAASFTNTTDIIARGFYYAT